MGEFNRRIQTTPLQSETPVGKIGQLAYPNSDFNFVDGGEYARVAANTRNPRPGDAVVRNTSGGYTASVSGDITQIVGIVYQRDGEVPRQSGSTNDLVVEYRNGEAIQVVTRGYVFLTVKTAAGEVIRANTELEYVPPASVDDESNWKIRNSDATTWPAANANLATIGTYLNAQMRYIKIKCDEETPVPASTTRIIRAFVYPI